MSDLDKDMQRSGKTVSVTLELDAEIYEFFSRKAQKLDLEVASYIAKTLDVVTGCRAFSENEMCSPKPVKNRQVT